MKPGEGAMTVAISTEESPDLAALGMNSHHLGQAAAELPLQLLADDVDLVYGGDLRSGGLADLLRELVLRYTSTADLLARRTRITNHLAWPVHIGMPFDEIESLRAELRGTAEVVLLPRDGTPLPMKARRALASQTPSDDEWRSGLTAMRALQCSSTDAVVLLGGHVEGGAGRIPDIAEKALLSLRSGKPLFLVGTFGGCARDVAETLGLVKPWRASRGAWPGRREFERWTGADLNNGLSLEKNELLARAPFMRHAVILVLVGVCRLRRLKCSRPP